MIRALYQIPLLLLLCTFIRASKIASTLPSDPSLEMQQSYNITKTSDVNQTTGNLSWGAANLPFASGAGAGITWRPGFLGGGFNAGSEKPGTAAIGGGWSINETNIVWGIGLKWDNKTIGVAIDGVKGGKLQIKINGKLVEIPE